MADLTEMCHCPAALTREHRVRVLNISELGCFVESRRRLDVGAVARLRLQLETGEYDDDVQVVRCQPNESGQALYDVAMRFLPTTPLHAESIRYAIARYAVELNFSETTLVM
jgi:PilZ domain